MIYSFNKLIDTIFVYYVTNRLYAFTTLVTVYDIQCFHEKKETILVHDHHPQLYIFYPFH